MTIDLPSRTTKSPPSPTTPHPNTQVPLPGSSARARSLRPRTAPRHLIRLLSFLVKCCGVCLCMLAYFVQAAVDGALAAALVPLHNAVYCMCTCSSPLPAAVAEASHTWCVDRFHQQVDRRRPGASTNGTQPCAHSHHRLAVGCVWLSGADLQRSAAADGAELHGHTGGRDHLVGFPSHHAASQQQFRHAAARPHFACLSSGSVCQESASDRL